MTNGRTARTIEALAHVASCSDRDVLTPHLYADRLQHAQALVRRGANMNPSAGANLALTTAGTLMLREALKGAKIIRENGASVRVQLVESTCWLDRRFLT